MMRHVVAVLVLLSLGVVVAAESEPEPSAPFEFSLLNLGALPSGPPPETAWLLLADQHNMGPLANADAPVQPSLPLPLEISWPSQTEQCVCERCPALYWDGYCPVCGRYVPGPERPESLDVTWSWLW